MTLQEAQQLTWFANTHYKLFIERTEIREALLGDYALVLEPIEGKQKIFRDAEKALGALAEWMAKSARANDRYFTIAEDGKVRERDFETWKKQGPENEKRT
jgi:hypothetical protein